MADEHEINETPATGEPGGTPEVGSQDLGDAGKKALAEERAARREADKQRKELEARLKDLEPLAAEAQKAKEARKSEAEKLNERLTATEKRAEVAEQKLLRAEVASEKGLTAAQARRLVGATKEELEADADDLLASFGASGDGESGGKGSGKKGRPSPDRLRPGGMPNPGPPTVAERIAEAEKAGKWDETRQLKTQQLVALATGGNQS
jgi:flagellar capping protein FliD